MSSSKDPPPEGPASVTGMYVPWRLGQAEEGESVRWSCVDGRWVSLSLGHDTEAGKTIVANSSGDRQVVDDYEAALALAKTWRV